MDFFASVCILITIMVYACITVGKDYDDNERY